MQVSWAGRKVWVRSLDRREALPRWRSVKSFLRDRGIIVHVLSDLRWAAILAFRPKGVYTGLPLLEALIFKGVKAWPKL